MLSNKWTFSLTSVVILLAIGLVASPAMAGFFGASIKAGELMYDVSTTGDDKTGVYKETENIQIESGRDRGDSYPTAITAGPFDDTPGAGPGIVFSISFDRVVQLQNVTADTVEPSGDELGIDDFVIDAFDDLGRSLGTLDLTGATAATTDDLGVLAFSTPRLTPVQDPVELPGRQFLLKIKNTALVNAYSTATGGLFEIHYLYLTLKAKSVSDASPEAIRKLRMTAADDEPFVADLSPEKPKFIRVDLVEKDEGYAQYANITSTSLVAEASNGTPGVVAITRVDPQSGIAATATGPFDVRIILTEKPKAFTKDHIHVRNGTPGDPVELLPIPATGLDQTDFPRLDYAEKGSPTDGVRAGWDPGLDPSSLTDTAFPNPTGRDNKYHLYRVTITPKHDFTGHVDVWVKSFMDRVKPTPNMYHALTEQIMVSDTLTLGARVARDQRAINGREVLSVPTKTGADTTSDKGATTVAYDARQKGTDVAGNFDSNPNLKALGAKLVIPANGYLVLAQAKSDATDILNSDPKEKKKLTAAQKLYNVSWEFVLPAPANSLSNYFRNGGTLQLVYADIPEATDSGHDDAKASAAGDDYTGYTGASSTPIAVGDVIINEIMWGSDLKGLFIELHNTTDAVIGIDKLEWAIMVGSGTPPAPFTTIDKVGNLPSTGYWEVPGSQPEPIIINGVLTDDVTPAVSMSRITGSTDGTAAASWAASARRMQKDDGTTVVNANVAGALIATPGAENAYVMPPKPEEVKPTPPTPVPVASAGDIKITEIMVPSNSGRLAQWVELSNMSAGEVSLTGWKLVVQNDPADTEVVGSAVTLDLGDVVVGVDKKGRKQSVLVVSKAGRSSGVGTGADAKGMLREERIINVQSQASPDDAKYSLISEMGFTLTLVAPPSVGVRTDADVVGNLLKGWELPMSEGNRSSIIRREGDMGEISGTDAAGWVLASETSLIGAYVGTYYGDKDDVGTPGYDAAGALPVELSKFGAKRDPLTGQVVVTWETQSELNNAGFYIKRAEHKTAQFVPVNPTMIPGAGTTSEKQSYTYMDTTAKPNIVYYYQIEDVSLDGNRQTLTRSHRLKGHIGAAGKLTTMWGELKEHE